jgi:DNA adenine methylase
VGAVDNWALPMRVGHIGTPPLKSQGIKTKLVPFIAQSISWDPGTDGRWIEPFVGTGSVALNLAPPRALLADANPHVIGVLRAIQRGQINAVSVKEDLTRMGEILAREGQTYYYDIRTRFNELGDPLDFLFLNRASFNGIIRFNKKGGFNTPFGHKPERFRGAFLTKIANQVAWTQSRMAGKDWQFEVCDWRKSLASATERDFVYLDPPYIGRNAAQVTRRSLAGYALSMWLENEYRKNAHVEEEWSGGIVRTALHFYHVGASEALRREMTEALVLKSGFESADIGPFVSGRSAAARAQDWAELWDASEAMESGSAVLLH